MSFEDVFSREWAQGIMAGFKAGKYSMKYSVWEDSLLEAARLGYERGKEERKK